ncbi:unnamed protein product [Pleuronectes platessa]|uniref:Uncharacterized protein n=1 Tax=Pleuronectes platessa TaxID=8262 RepID=A0A9N7VDH2_PLEPL|nr:unnamed protein product [Pleuronectes platessa]
MWGGGLVSCSPNSQLLSVEQKSGVTQDIEYFLRYQWLLGPVLPPPTPLCPLPGERPSTETISANWNETLTFLLGQYETCSGVSPARPFVKCPDNVQLSICENQQEIEMSEHTGRSEGPAVAKETLGGSGSPELAEKSSHVHAHSHALRDAGGPAMWSGRGRAAAAAPALVTPLENTFNPAAATAAANASAALMWDRCRVANRPLKNGIVKQKGAKKIHHARKGEGNRGGLPCQ